MNDDRLKLVALDADDLEVISVHLQDAVLKIGDMTWLPAEHRFAAVLNRFDWEHGITRKAGPWRRRRSGLSFDRAQAAQIKNLRTDQADAVLELLAIEFEPADPPGGTVILQFAGGGAVRLQVECIEARFSDLGPAWETVSRPEHDSVGEGQPENGGS